MTDINVPPFPPLGTPLTEKPLTYVSEFWANWFALVMDSIRTIVEEVEVIEYHFHNTEKWFGIASPQTATNWGTIASISPFTATSGNNTYGADASDEAQVIGSGDTPVAAGKTKFDLHQLFVVAVSSATVYKLRIVWGTGTMADAITAGQFSTTITRIDVANPAQSDGFPFDIMMPRLDVGTKVWVQAWNATNNATITFLVGFHEYDD